MAHTELIRCTPSNSDIPDKLYFRIGDVAKLCEVPAYVLRFWESEFPQFKPNKGGTGQRLYRRKDVEMALRIKRLLYDEGYTIPGARQVFKQEQSTSGPQLALSITPSPPARQKDFRRLQLVRKDLQELHALLSGPVQWNKTSEVRMRSATRPARHALTLTSRNAVSTMDELFDAQTNSYVESEPSWQE